MCSLDIVALILAHWTLLSVSCEWFDLIVSISKLLCIDVVRRHTRVLGRADELNSAKPIKKPAIRC